ncbi:hypothetical protein FTO70_04185 [Methanosarcina sp. KYL-1]|uniref:hypothetical protein n=1 Tax=Methanosarcina sp. KYL-1 TaxID=2602068 RepID=UPI0021012F54|nr:hypothetical protein [Methanosarcina sp. KYL-1]MCQ1534901.1 hypothetical protein [Methanosarcina sp. KYL-1]
MDYFNAGPEVVKSGELSTLNWGVSGVTDITIEPDVGTVESAGTFQVSPAETTTYKLTASDGGEEKVAFCTITVEKEPLIINSFDANPDVIEAGGNTTLNWRVSGVENVTIEPDIGTVESAGTLPVSPAETTTYKLTASNDEEEDIAYCIITVEQKLPAINVFNANSDVIEAGGSTDLTWNVSDATRVYIEPGIGAVGLSGSQRVFLSESTTYTLIATNDEGSSEATKLVLVDESPAPDSPAPPPTPQ